MEDKRKMKIKSLRVLILLMFSLVLLYPAYAAGGTTYVTPTAGGTLTGTYTVYATHTANGTTGVGGVGNLQMAQLWYRNGTEAWNLLLTNESSNLSGSVTFTINASNLLVDTATATLNITLSNVTSNITTTLDVDADSEEPNLYILELNREQTEVLSELGIESNCKATDTVDTSLTCSYILTRPDTSTITSSDCGIHTWRNSDLPMVDTSGNYLLNCSVTDNANLQSSKTIKIPVYGTKDKAVVISTTTTATIAKPSNTKGFMFLIIGSVLVVIVIVVIIVLTSKKR